ncbi:hypothetical protein SAMN06295909_2521 [Plantibacter sp. VKM Ac-1784]|uniref:DUF1453 domain-containing protein n=1 Tax=Plantibacter elymi (nom. nud.) TaxID=199708 RepID=A0ABY1RHM8_9MICO|nr:hypothetical protein [Plantibacter sp. VKM Ac-1784]SMQ71277.1 hypothetical protein SAMN06295909_2521 [Plantibacter sp. VKM Ac-1784]
MQWNWGTANKSLDDVIIAAGIIILIVRQFIWRSTQLHRMLLLPVVIIAAGLVYLVIELWGGFGWAAADWIIIGELVLVTVTGTVMGLVTRFRTTDAQLQYKLSPAGIWLWALFIVIRVGSFYLASVLGANLAEATGLILLSFGANRLAAILVVRKRAEGFLARASGEVGDEAP